MNIIDTIKRFFLKFRGYISENNDGLIPEKQPKKGWVFGNVIKILNKLKDWIPLLPIDELQKKFGLETMNCVPNSGSNVCDMIMNHKIENNLISKDNLEWLKDPLGNGTCSYIVDGKFNSNERVLGKLSFTSHNGNTGSRLFGAMKNYGLVPESAWPWTDSNINTWEEYFATIPQWIKNLGYEFKRRFPIRYYIVHRADFGEALQESPLQVYVDGRYNIRGGVLQYSSRMSTHAVALVKEDEKYYYIYDSYEPFIKKVVKNYPFYTGQNMYNGQKYSYGYKVNILENIIKKKMIKTIKQKNQKEVYAIDLEAGTLNSFGGWGSYKKFLDAKWCEPFLEVEEKYAYLRQAYGKGFVKGSEVGIIK